MKKLSPEIKMKLMTPGCRSCSEMIKKGESKKTIESFLDKILEQKPLDPEFSKTVDDNFWNLI